MTILTFLINRTFCLLIVTEYMPKQSFSLFCFNLKTIIRTGVAHFWIVASFVLALTSILNAKGNFLESLRDFLNLLLSLPYDCLKESKDFYELPNFD